jgi:hypothetical protein
MVLLKSMAPTMAVMAAENHIFATGSLHETC